jgi:hypothetical protein
MPPANTTSESQRQEPANIVVTAHGDRRALEALYLQLRELAKQKGLKIECRLGMGSPGDNSGS